MALGSSAAQTCFCTGKGYGDHQGRQPCLGSHHQHRNDPKARRLTGWTQTGVSCCLGMTILCALVSRGTAGAKCQVQAASDCCSRVSLPPSS